MKNNIEKGLASHSSIMISAQELSGDCEEGWTYGASRETLRRLRKISKNNATKSNSRNSNTSDKEVVQASSENESIKSSKSGISWSSIVKDPFQSSIKVYNFDPRKEFF